MDSCTGEIPCKGSHASCRLASVTFSSSLIFQNRESKMPRREVGCLAPAASCLGITGSGSLGRLDGQDAERDAGLPARRVDHAQRDLVIACAPTKSLPLLLCCSA